MVRFAVLLALALALGAPSAAAGKVSGGFASGTVTLAADDAGGAAYLSQSAEGVMSIFIGEGGTFSGCPLDEAHFASCSGVTAVSFTGAAGDDTFVAYAGVSAPITAEGGPGADTLTGGDAPDALRGGPGADTLDGTLDAVNPSAGDLLDGGPDDDLIDSRGGYRLELADTVTCAGGTDHLRSDLRVDVSTGCEELEPQIVGPVSYTGTVAAGGTVAMSTPVALGTPTPTVTFEWLSCGRYTCGVFATGQSHTLSASEMHDLSTYPSVGMRAQAVATNAFGTDTVGAVYERPANWIPSAGVPTSTAVATDGRTETAPVPPMTALELARRVLSGPLVAVPRLTRRSLAVFRRREPPRLSRRVRAHVFALVCTSGMCQVTLTPSLALRGRKTMVLATQRRRIMSGTSAPFTVRLTRAQRRALRRAGVGRLRVRGTLRVDGKTSRLDARIPVR